VSSRALKVLGVSVPGLILCALVGIMVGTGAYTYSYGEGFSYLSNNPAACVNCHIMRDHYDGWAKSSHHAVATCNDCHTPHDLIGKYTVKAENGFWHSKAFTLQDFHDPLIIRPRNSRVLQGGCVHCHRELVADILRDESNQGGESRRLDGGAAQCVRCHASVGHGPTR
jgi:cytochrome c nitrite reductase small subunit